MDYEQLVPQRLDIFAFIIFLGVVQGFFFAYFLLRKPKVSGPKNTYLGLFLFIYSAALLEVFLCYTGLIVHVLWLVDYSESANFLNGPLLYFLVLSFLQKDLPRKHMLHYLPFIFYLLYMGFFFLQGPEHKFNAFISAYYPDLEHVESIRQFSADPLGIKKYINPISVIHSAIYIGLSMMAIFKAIRKDQLRFFRGADKEIAWMRNLLILGVISYLFWVVKSFTGLRDVQDHIGATLHTLIIYFVGFRILREGVTSPVKPADKYSKSSLSVERKQRIIQRLDQLNREESYYLDHSLSMADLAKKTGTTHHHLSQVLNEELGQSYTDYINTLRVDYAKKLLLEKPNTKIEEIAEQAGFNSKSTFNTAFKKFAGLTPSLFRSQLNS